MASDPFAVVRATSEAAYQSGRARFDRGEFREACIDLDKAKTNDPDKRADIEQALSAALSRCLFETPPAQTTATPRAIAVATLPPPPTVGPPAAAARTPTPPPVAAPKPTSVSSPVPTAPVQPKPAVGPTASAAQLTTWRDPQGRFSVGAPTDWSIAPQPTSLFGTNVVEFVEPSGRAAFDIALDTSSRAVSPELYAASMELAMQKQLPGYAGEQVLPGSTSGSPSMRRVFTFMRRDASGRDAQARTLQVTVLKGSTPYILTGSAPAEQFSLYSPTFEQMLESFRFS